MSVWDIKITFWLYIVQLKTLGCWWWTVKYPFKLCSAHFDLLIGIAPLFLYTTWADGAGQPAGTRRIYHHPSLALMCSHYRGARARISFLLYGYCGIYLGHERRLVAHFIKERTISSALDSKLHFTTTFCFMTQSFHTRAHYKPYCRAIKRITQFSISV